jgi:threonine synthase
MNQLVCRSCARSYSLSDPRWKCDCGGLLDIDFTPLLDPQRIRARRPTLWRYREALPIDHDENIITFGEGFTPLTPVDFSGRAVLVKQDHLFPTGSYKDRGAAVLISKIKELGVREVVEDSSGNAGCAVAAYCASAGIRCQIYVPEDTALGKLAQIQLYGAGLNRIPGSREATAQAVMAAAQQIYYASHSWNPFFFQGTKTWAYEVWEQLDWQAPDTVILPAGNGTLVIGAAIGFRELAQAGLIQRAPKIIAVQAEGCAPLAEVYRAGLSALPAIDKKDTLAEGIAIAAPIRGMQIVGEVHASGGEFLTVTEAEIGESLRAICRQGLYIEPTSAATTAGVAQYLRRAPRDERIVSVFTGHGLKATEKMMKFTVRD